MQLQCPPCYRYIGTQWANIWKKKTIYFRHNGTTSKWCGALHYSFTTILFHFWPTVQFLKVDVYCIYSIFEGYDCQNAQFIFSQKTAKWNSMIILLLHIKYTLLWPWSSRIDYLENNRQNLSSHLELVSISENSPLFSEITSSRWLQENNRLIFSITGIDDQGRSNVYMTFLLNLQN